MKPKSQPYRRSIWHHDGRYDLAHKTLGIEQFETIARLSSVDAAKKRIPAIPPSQLLEISRAAKEMPKIALVTLTDVVGFLRQGLRYYGAGIPTLICMLAVETQGEYPPMDRKFSAGLEFKQKITSKEKDILASTKVDDFAEVYVNKVIPVWRESRELFSAEDADNYWGAAGGTKG